MAVSSRVERCLDDKLLERLSFYEKRSAGPLDGATLALVEGRGIALAYDPAQIGWVLLDCEDDWAEHDAPQDPAAGSAAGAPERSRSGARLRPWRDEEARVFLELLDDPEVWRHLPEEYPGQMTEAMARDLIAVSNASAHHEVLAAEVHGAPVGQVRLLFDLSVAAQREAEISYWLGRRCWGRGIGGDIVRLYTQDSFRRRPELRAIHARVRHGHVASERVLAKAGYRLDGPAPDDPAVRVWRIERNAGA